MGRKVGKTVTRKGVRVNAAGQPKVVTTRKPKGIAAKLLDAALKAAGK